MTPTTQIGSIPLHQQQPLHHYMRQRVHRIAYLSVLLSFSRQQWHVTDPGVAQKKSKLKINPTKIIPRALPRVLNFVVL